MARTIEIKYLEDNAFLLGEGERGDWHVLFWDCRLP